MWVKPIDKQPNLGRREGIVIKVKVIHGSLEITAVVANVITDVER